MTVNDVLLSLYADAHAIHEPDDGSVYWQVTNQSGESIGTMLRTSPASDNIVGYQGPTDPLIAFDSARKVVGVALLRSFDNEPHVGWVREDEYFRTLFDGLTLNDRAEFDAEVAQVEGVSGATMTSMAIVHGLVVAAERQRGSAAAIGSGTDKSAERTNQRAAAFHWKLRDTGTAIVILFGWRFH